MMDEQIGQFAMRLVLDGVPTVVRSTSRMMMDIIAKYAAERERMSEAEKMQALYKKHPIEAFLKEGKEPGAMTLLKEDAQKVVEKAGTAGIPIYVVTDEYTNHATLAFDKKVSSVLQQYMKQLGIDEYNVSQSTTKKEVGDRPLHTDINLNRNKEEEHTKNKEVRDDKSESRAGVQQEKRSEESERNFPQALKEKTDLSEPHLIVSQECEVEEASVEKDILTDHKDLKQDSSISKDDLPDPAKQPISLNHDAKNNKRKKSFKEEFYKYEQEAKLYNETRKQAHNLMKNRPELER